MTPESAEVPTCPYCGVPWTAAMLHTFDRYARGISCTCCVLLPGLDLGPDRSAEPVAPPQQDLCCDGCGKPIYTAPKFATYVDQPAPDARQYRNSSQS